MACDYIPEYPDARPLIVVSKCLGFENVRYDGGIIHSQIIEDIYPFADFITVCPEVEIGLGVPRDVIRIVKKDGKKRLVQPKTKKDVTEMMDNFTDKFLGDLPLVDGFIFKSKSPTIGIRNVKIYSDIEKNEAFDHGSGFFAEKIIKKYAKYPMEEEDRLRNKIIRHHFLTKLFTFADFRNVKLSNSTENLRLFHSYNRFLFRLYDRNMSLEMDEFIEKTKSSKFETSLNEYEKMMKHTLSNFPKSNEYSTIANEIFHSIHDSLNKVERDYLTSEIKKYETNRLGCDALLDILKLYVMRFGESKNEFSRLFSPYPDTLKSEVETDRDRDFWSKYPSSKIQ